MKEEANYIATWSEVAAALAGATWKWARTPAVAEKQPIVLTLIYSSNAFDAYLFDAVKVD